MRRTYRYRLYPTRRQVAALEHQLGQACDLYNAALEHRRSMWRDHGVRVTYYDQAGEMKYLRGAGLLDPTANHSSQREALQRLDRAFEAFFRRAKAGEKPGFPRFRSRSRYDSLTWEHGSGCHVRGGRLALQAVGSVRVRWHRSFPNEATVTTVQVKRTAGRWYVCFFLNGVAPEPLPSSRVAVGIDLGISTFAALSTGELIAGPRAERTAGAAVRRAQRKVARRRRGSGRRRKAVTLLARHRERERNRRRDHAHKTARAVVERFGLIAVEDLNVAGLARGMLARDVHDQGWAAFVALLREKAEGAARELVLVDARGTSQVCSACGGFVPKALSVRVHRCPCGYVADRDVNAARNIERLGRSRQAITVDEEVEPSPAKPSAVPSRSSTERLSRAS